MQKLMADEGWGGGLALNSGPYDGFLFYVII